MGALLDDWKPISAALGRNTRPHFPEPQSLLPPTMGLSHSLHDVFQLLLDESWAQLTHRSPAHWSIRSAPLPDVVISLFDETTAESLSTVTFLTVRSCFQSRQPAPTTWNSLAICWNQFAALSSHGLSDDRWCGWPHDHWQRRDQSGDSGSRYDGTQRRPMGRPFRPSPIPMDVHYRHAARWYLLGTAGGGSLLDDAASYTFRAVDGVVLAAGDYRGGVNLVVDEGATIRGTVNGPSGPVAGAVVAALNADGIGYSAISSDLGTYTIDSLPAGNFTVAAGADGLVRAEVSGIAVDAAGDVSGIDFNLVTAGSISGTVTQMSDGSPAAFAIVIAEDGTTSFSTQADEQGNYTLAELPPSAYTVRTVGSNFMTAETTANVMAGSDVTANISTGPLGTVSGVVTNSTNGSPLANVVVYARQDGGLVDSTVTDATGGYLIGGFDTGDVTILLGDVITPGIAAAEVTLSPSSPNVALDLSTAVAGILSGTVFDSDGTTPVEGATVGLFLDDQFVLATQSLADGHYSFVITADGTYRLQAVDDNGIYAEIDNVVVAGGATLSGLDFVGSGDMIRGNCHRCGDGIADPRCVGSDRGRSRRITGVDDGNDDGCQWTV